MSVADAEIPGSTRGRKGGREALPEPITPLNRPIYLLAFSILGIALVILVAGWIVLAAMGKEVPEALPVVIGTIVGGLVGVITTNKTA